MRKDELAPRLGLGVTTALARRNQTITYVADAAGVPLNSLQRICRGESTQASLYVVVKLAEYLGCTVDSLFSVPRRA